MSLSTACVGDRSGAELGATPRGELNQCAEKLPFRPGTSGGLGAESFKGQLFVVSKQQTAFC